MKTIITSSGIIRNADKPRCGIVNANSLESFIYDDIHDGIDLDYELFVESLKKEGYDEDTIDKKMNHYENDEPTILFGDWIKESGQYRPDKFGKNGFSAEFRAGIISVEFSKTVTRCHNTSPCYVMANGDGPCGNLDQKSSQGEVLAFDLPVGFYPKQ